MFLLYWRLEYFHKKEHWVGELSSMIWVSVYLVLELKLPGEHRLSTCVPTLHWSVAQCFLIWSQEVGLTQRVKIYERTDLGSIYARTKSGLKMVVAPLAAMSSPSAYVQSQVSEELIKALEIQEAPWSVNTWHHFSTGSTSGSNTLAGLAIRKHVQLSKGEKWKTNISKRNRHGETNSSSTTKKKKQKPRSKVKDKKRSLEEAPEVTSRLRQPSRLGCLGPMLGYALEIPNLTRTASS